jgi:hypothetical protein
MDYGSVFHSEMMRENVHMSDWANKSDDTSINSQLIVAGLIMIKYMHFK